MQDTSPPRQPLYDIPHRNNIPLFTTIKKQSIFNISINCKKFVLIIIKIIELKYN